MSTYKKARVALLIFGLLTLAFNIWELTTGQVKQKAGIIFIIECLMGIGLIYGPELFRKWFKLEFPAMTVYMYWLFIFMSVFLGTCLHLMSIWSFWDKVLHAFSPMILTAVGYGLICMYLKDTDMKNVSPWLFIIFGLSFAGICGVIWEFWEALCDILGDMNLQRYRLSNGTPLVGREALKDTMGDLLTNTIGAVIFTIYAAFDSKGNPLAYEKYRIRFIK